MSIQTILTKSVNEAVTSLYDCKEVIPQISLTKKDFEGHYTIIVFPYLKYSRKSPEITAKEIGEKLISQCSDIVSNYNVLKGFLNLVLTEKAFIKELEEISRAENYGHIKPSKDAPLVMVEYSSPNTNKPLHLGHIRNNLLGYSLCQILEANGNRVVKTNIVNDRGIHICKSMLAWQRWGNGETPQTSGLKGDHLIGKYYVLYNNKLKEEIEKLSPENRTDKYIEENVSLVRDAREMLRKWEAGDPGVISLWKKINNWVYEGFDETYRRLGVSFDKIYYESDTYLVGKDEVLKGLDKGLFFRKEDNSVWANLQSYGLDEKLLLRSDGTSVYMTQDIGTAKMRSEDFNVDKMIYVVGNEQNYHFQVLSILLNLLNIKFGKDLIHFSYGMVELPDGKMKSREGTVVDADDLMDEVIEIASNMAREQGKVKNLSENEAKEVARKVGLGALKYFLLKVDPKKTLLFDKEESIDFNGNTAPFLQYTYARIKSILRKADEQAIDVSKFSSDKISLLDTKEKELILKLTLYPEIVQNAGKDLSPAIIANYLYELAKQYNQFYHELSILNTENDSQKIFRIILSKTTSNVIKNGLELLGIEVPEKM